MVFFLDGLSVALLVLSPCLRSSLFLCVNSTHRFWWLSFSAQTDNNTRGRTTSTGALQYHCVGQALLGSALPLLARFPCLLVREFDGNLQRHLARVQKVVCSLLVFPSLFPESDSRWKVASCWEVVCLAGLFVIGDQFRYGFHSSVVDSMPLIGVADSGCSQRHTLKLRWHDRLWSYSGLTLL